MIFRENCSCIMTSATLSVGRKDLAYFRQRIGAEEAEPALLGGPFDFQKQMKMFIVKKMPDPRHAQYEEALEHWVAHFVEKTDGRAFVLFTKLSGDAAGGRANGAILFAEEIQSAGAGRRRAARKTS
jgi:Rad3-related DNA helicases